MSIKSSNMAAISAAQKILKCGGSPAAVWAANLVLGLRPAGMLEPVFDEFTMATAEEDVIAAVAA